MCHMLVMCFSLFATVSNLPYSTSPELAHRMFSGVLFLLVNTLRIFTFSELYNKCTVDFANCAPLFETTVSILVIQL